MGRHISPFLVVTFLFLTISCVPTVVQAPENDWDTYTDRPDYFLGDQVQANFVIKYTGFINPPLEAEFQWYDPLGVLLYNETQPLVLYQSENKNYAGAFSNWTANMTGKNFTVRGIHVSGQADANFNVSAFNESVYVYSLSVSLNRNFYENGTVAHATSTLDYLGNGTKLKNVSFVWRYPNSTVAFSENKPLPDGGMNGTTQAISSWRTDFEGKDFEVEATYQGVEPLTDTALFDVIPVRVNTWRNNSDASGTWTPGNSPYGVCNNVTVPHGSTMTVDAGTTIKFCPDSSLIVHGTVQMVGLFSSNITLTSLAYPESKGDWKGVIFEDDSDDINSMLTHVIVDYSQRGLVLNGAAPQLQNVSVANASVSGMEVHQSTVTASGMNITDSPVGIHAINSTLNLLDSEIRLGSDGLIMEDSNGTIEGNWIHDNINRGIWLIRSSPLIRYNLLTSNLNRGIRIEESQGILLELNNISWSNITFESYIATDITISRTVILNADQVSLSFSVSDDILVVNSTIEITPESFRVAGGSTVTALNCTFDDTLVWVTSGSWLYVKNFLDAKVSDVAGPPLEGASVVVFENEVSMSPKSTGADGWVRWIIVLHETFSGLPGDPNVTSVRIEVTLNRYNITNSPRDVNMSVSRAEEFEGYPIGGPPDGNGDLEDMMLILIAVAIIIAVVVIILLFLVLRRKKEEEPEVEEEVGPREFELKEGRSYVVASDGVDRSFKKLIEEAEEGSNTLCFTRTYPPNLEDRYDLDKTKVVWLSRDTEKGGLMPTNLGLITKEVVDLLGEHKDERNVIMIDGLEYLITQNSFTKIIKLTNYLKDIVGVNKAVMLMPFNLKSLDEKEVALFTADVEIIE